MKDKIKINFIVIRDNFLASRRYTKGKIYEVHLNWKICNGMQLSIKPDMKGKWHEINAINDIHKQ